MALFKLALLLSIGFQGCALTSALNPDVSQSDPDALRGTQTGDICHDCTQIFELLADLLSNADLQKKMILGIESLCDLLPGETSKLCKNEVETMFPLAITFITGVAKPAQICKALGLCGSCNKQEMMTRYFATEALQAALTSENVKPKTECSFCLFLIKTLEDLLPKERTETSITKLLEEICHILPSTYKDQCKFVIDKFTKTILDALLHYATPQNICALLHMCHGQDAAVVDPCTLATYRCRDIRTSVQCGTLFYCQRFAWKPTKYNTV